VEHKGSGEEAELLTCSMAELVTCREGEKGERGERREKERQRERGGTGSGVCVCVCVSVLCPCLSVCAIPPLLLYTYDYCHICIPSDINIYFPHVVLQKPESSDKLNFQNCKGFL